MYGKLKGPKGVTFKEGGEFDIQEVGKDVKGKPKRMTAEEKKKDNELKKKN
jgi:hypothetical protein